MASAVETDLSQLDLLFSLHRRFGAAIDTREIAREIRERVREELDYEREAKIARLYRVMLADRPFVRVPRVEESLSTGRLLTLEWLDGEPLVAFESASQEARDAIAVGLFEAWWRPFIRYGIIHGDPHLGNYSVAGSGPAESGQIDGLNLFDYGCVRIFPPRFVLGVVELYRALKADDPARIAHAYEMWGFPALTRGIFDAMTIWARFICGPILDDRVRTAADGVSPAEYGRREIGAVMRALRAEGGGLVVPREFVFLERATIGLGGAFLRLGARLNFHRMYEEAIADFDEDAVGAARPGRLPRSDLRERPIRRPTLRPECVSARLTELRSIPYNIYMPMTNRVCGGFAWLQRRQAAASGPGRGSVRPRGHRTDQRFEPRMNLKGGLREGEVKLRRACLVVAHVGIAGPFACACAAQTP